MDANIPLLQQGLLEDRYFYGWESNDAFSLEARMQDEQHPHHVARILALEQLTGAPIDRAVNLTADERAQLFREAFTEGEPGNSPDVARWLLLELTPESLVTTGAPPPPEPRAAATTSHAHGLIVAAHGTTHHDVAVLAAISAGRIEAVAQRTGCFEELGVTLPCCGGRSTLNELRYEMRQGFARFVLEVGNPNIDQLPDDLSHELAKILGRKVRAIWARY